MLVLTRKTDERIHVGNDIVITVVRVSGNRVSLGIEAPAGVRVLREELTPSETRPNSASPAQRKRSSTKPQPASGVGTPSPVNAPSRRTVAEIMAEAMSKLASRTTDEISERSIARREASLEETSHARASA